jgi:hypothetical protein
MNLLTNPDTFIDWYRIDEPGENPTWESQCGLIEQISFGNNPQFKGFVKPDNPSYNPKTFIVASAPSFAATKRSVELVYQKNHKLHFVHEEDEIEEHSNPHEFSTHASIKITLYHMFIIC